VLINDELVWSSTVWANVMFSVFSNAVTKCCKIGSQSKSCNWFTLDRVVSSLLGCRGWIVVEVNVLTDASAECIADDMTDVGHKLG
jgi:hypothetical protein